MNWENSYQEKLISMEEAAKKIRSGDRIGMAPGPSAPIELLNTIAKRYEELEDVKVYSGLLLRPADHLEGRFKGHINHISFFMGPVERMFLSQGNVSVIAYQFSRMDILTNECIKPNVALIECSPPDKNGYISFGPMGTTTNYAYIQNADLVIAQINSRVPYIYGGLAHIHVNAVDYFCENDHELEEIPMVDAGEDEKKIAAYIVNEIPDAATIQLGIGSIADAVGSQLETKNDLGVHTEMLTNSMVTLAKKGVVTCAKKTLHPDKLTCGFGVGVREMYDFMDQNQMVEILPISFVNDPRVVGKNDNFMSINSTLMTDLTGQVCSESIGFNQYSGTGGQLDFVRGARYSKGGKSFIALLSTADTKNGKVSKISCALPPGTAITTPRTDTMYVVTEHGIANLWGRSLTDRVEALISIAHPQFRDQLMQEAKDAKLI